MNISGVYLILIRFKVIGWVWLLGEGSGCQCRKKLEIAKRFGLEINYNFGGLNLGKIGSSSSLKNFQGVSRLKNLMEER